MWKALIISLAACSFLLGCTQSDGNIQFKFYQQVGLESVNRRDFNVAGGESLIITGSGFNKSSPQVFIGNTLCSNVTINSDTELLCILPSVSGPSLQELKIVNGSAISIFPRKLSFNVVVYL